MLLEQQEQHPEAHRSCQQEVFVRPALHYSGGARTPVCPHEAQCTASASLRGLGVWNLGLKLAPGEEGGRETALGVCGGKNSPCGDPAV